MLVPNKSSWHILKLIGKTSALSDSNGADFTMELARTCIFAISNYEGLVITLNNSLCYRVGSETQTTMGLSCDQQGEASKSGQ